MCLPGPARDTVRLAELSQQVTKCGYLYSVKLVTPRWTDAYLRQNDVLLDPAPTFMHAITLLLLSCICVRR